MSMFPGPGAVVYYNEAGEPLGWDYPSSDAEYNDDPYDDDNGWVEEDGYDDHDDDDDYEEYDNE